MDSATRTLTPNGLLLSGAKAGSSSAYSFAAVALGIALLAALLAGSAPLGFSIALVWLIPQAWDLALVYLHPCVALIFLDRELARRNHAWKRAYRCCLAAVPLLLAFLWWKLADTPSLPGDDALTVRITRHAGA